MKRKNLCLGVVAMCLATSIHAGDIDKLYQKTYFVIKNNTNHIEVVSLFDVNGKWKTPWMKNTSFQLAPNQIYKNALYPIKKNNDNEDYTSITVSQADNPKENYLIFATDSSSKSQRVSGDIFDGLGSMFVASWTNYCKGKTEKGYDLCELTIRSKT